jgi:hypothetical protein
MWDVIHTSRAGVNSQASEVRTYGETGYRRTRSDASLDSGAGVSDSAARFLYNATRYFNCRGYKV